MCFATKSCQISQISSELHNTFFSSMMRKFCALIVMKCNGALAAEDVNWGECVKRTDVIIAANFCLTKRDMHSFFEEAYMPALVE